MKKNLEDICEFAKPLKDSGKYYCSFSGIICHRAHEYETCGFRLRAIYLKTQKQIKL